MADAEIIAVFILHLQCICWFGVFNIGNFTDHILSLHWIIKLKYVVWYLVILLRGGRWSWFFFLYYGNCHHSFATAAYFRELKSKAWEKGTSVHCHRILEQNGKCTNESTNLCYHYDFQLDLAESKSNRAQTYLGKQTSGLNVLAMLLSPGLLIIGEIFWSKDIKLWSWAYGDICLVGRGWMKKTLEMEMQTLPGNFALGYPLWVMSSGNCEVRCSVKVHSSIDFAL